MRYGVFALLITLTPCPPFDALTDYEVFIELQIIIEGRSYSWHSINQGLQAQVDNGLLTDQIVIQRWNFLCGEKRRWEHVERHSFICQRYNRGYLFSLTTILMLAGFGKSYPVRVRSPANYMEALRFITQNIDSPNIPSNLLGLDVEEWDLDCLWEEEYRF